MSGFFPSPTLERVLAGQLCSGCGLCAGTSGGAIAMGVSADGYNRPIQHGPISAQAETIVADACPGSRVAPWADDGSADPYWGPARSVHTGFATDAEIRHLASSGGLLSALLIHALESGRIDAVAQIVADPASPTGNMLRLSRTPADVLAAAGSRYAPSSPLAEIDALLSGSERLALVGKPCDISALRQLAKHDPRVGERIPLMLSFFCGGIPSARGATAVLDALGVAADEVDAFRYRGNGWPGFATATRRDGSSERMSYAESWGRHLSPTVQFRCKICPDAVGGVADIACADAWYGDESGYPLFEEQDGRSLLLARTEAGTTLVEAALAAGAIALTPLDIAEIDRMQPAQARRKRLIRSRLLALAAIGRPRFRAPGLAIGAAARRAPFIEQVKSFAGMIRRTLMRAN